MKQSTRWILIFNLFFFACSNKLSNQANSSQPIHNDVAYLQDFSIKYNLIQDSTQLYQVYCDLNGDTKIHSSAGLLKKHAGDFLYPGTLVPDVSYRPIAGKKIAGMGLYNHQFVYLDDKAILSNAWAGKLYSQHTLPKAILFAGGEDFAFLISDGQSLQYVKDSQVLWQGKATDQVINIIFDKSRNLFWILGKQTISTFSAAEKSIAEAFKSNGNNFTCFTLTQENKELVVGTTDGYFTIEADTKKQKGEVQKKLPWTALTTVQEINGKLWFGSTKGAFMLREDGKFNYYASKRWLPSDSVTHITKGYANTVLILTDKGLGEINFKEMTLHDKALFYEKQVRTRHIRNGFNASIARMKEGDITTGTLEDSDNDGLWTSMYLGSQVFRYAVTKSEEALQNCRESMDAMERLYAINPVKGFPARSFERKGYALHDTAKWILAPHPEWDWKSTTSSDEAIGHIFVFGAMAELLEDKDLKKRAIVLIDSLMQHVIDHDLYLVDWDGKPTLWGKWNPEYVNARPKGVGDRKINSSNIIAMLQTAYHFTGKESYKEKAFELMNKHGYLENLMKPMGEIGMAPADADDWSKMLSESWNHSDDEMYFLGYWGLYRYALNDSLKSMYKESIIDHWEAERPEKEGAWNIFTAMTGVKEFDLTETIWYLQEYPLDLVHWKVSNSQRKDIEPMAPNFRNQTIKEVLPPDELEINRHNANRFDLDGGSGGTSEYSAGDIWLLPYWMGRYLGVISGPAATQPSNPNTVISLQ